MIMVPLAVIYNLWSAKNAQGFENDLDVRNMDLQHFRILLAAKSEQNLHQPTDRT